MQTTSNEIRGFRERRDNNSMSMQMSMSILISMSLLMLVVMFDLKLTNTSFHFSSQIFHVLMETARVYPWKVIPVIPSRDALLSVLENGQSSIVAVVSQATVVCAVYNI